MSDPLVQPNQRPTGVRWAIFALGFGTSWVLYLHRYTFALIKPALQEEHGWSTVELGLLDSTFQLSYALCQLPSGILADLLGIHLFLGGIILLWSLALAMHAWAPDLAWMRGVRAVFGVAQAGAFAMLNSICRTWFPLSVRTSVQGWIGVFAGRIGGASANLLFAWLLLGIVGLTWRQGVYVFAGAGVALGIVFLFVFRDSPKEHPWSNEAEAQVIEGDDAERQPSSAPRPPIRDLLRRMSVRSVCNLFAFNVQSALSTVADNIYLSWIPLFLYQVHGLSYKELGVLSMLPLLGGACGGAAGGYLNDFLIPRIGQRWARRMAGLLGKGTAGLLLFSALLLYDRPYHFCAMLFFVKFFGDWSLASAWGTVTDIGGRASATVFAWNNAIGSGTAVLAPLLFGFVAQHYSWHMGFTIVATIYALCAASWLLVDCTIPIVRPPRSKEA